MNDKPYPELEKEKNSTLSNLLRIPFKYIIYMFAINIGALLLIQSEPTLGIKYYYILIATIIILIFFAFSNQATNKFPSEKEFREACYRQLEYFQYNQGDAFDVPDGTISITTSNVDNPINPNVKIFGIIIKSLNGFPKLYHAVLSRDLEILSFSEGKYSGEIYDIERFKNKDGNKQN